MRDSPHDSSVDGEIRVRSHDELRDVLRKTQGRNCDIVALFVDIRGFSSFAERNDSPAIAKYLRTAITQILDHYFPDASFFKLTGDGVLIIYEHPDDEGAMRDLLTNVLKKSIALVANFSDIADDDVMVTIRDLPKSVGIGIARGSATCLVATDGTIVDYTGRCLNLAARAMDKARPKGVVFADTHAATLIEESLGLDFQSDEIYVRGIAEKNPISVRATLDVAFRAADRKPIDEDEGIGEPVYMSIEEVRATSGHAFYLPRPPEHDEIALVWIEYPYLDAVTGKMSKKHLWHEARGKVERHPDGTVIVISFDTIKRRVVNVPEKSEGFLGFKTKNYVTLTPMLRFKKK